MINQRGYHSIMSPSNCPYRYANSEAVIAVEILYISSLASLLLCFFGGSYLSICLVLASNNIVRKRKTLTLKSLIKHLT